MKSHLGMLAAVAFLTAAVAGAQEPPGRLQAMSPGSGPSRPGGSPGRGDALAEQFFPPELIMRNSDKIGLTADQESAIKTQMQQAQGQFIDLEWKLHHEKESFQALVQKDKPDEAQTLAQLDKLLKVENEVKKAQTTLMVRIKNVLTPEQQSQLRQMRRQPPRGDNPPGVEGPRRGAPGRGGNGPGGPPPQAPGAPPQPPEALPEN